MGARLTPTAQQAEMEQAMKIYLFNSETGYYLGEDFADEGDGTCRVPLDATTVAPPKAGPGEVPVFDPTSKVWTLQRRFLLSAVEADADAAVERPQFR